MKKFIITVFAALLAAIPARATTFIKDVMLIGGTRAETSTLRSSLAAQGWTFINYDLNKGCGSSSDYVYLLYKAEENTDGVNWGYITDFIIHEEKNPPSTLTHNGRLYYKAPYDGGDWFVSHYGDLNSNSSGAYIYLYYTKAHFPDNRAVTSITINATSSGAVGWDGNSSSPADLNKGCGSDTPYIYMHFTTATATSNQPQANLEACTAGKYQLSVSGWAYDPDITAHSIGVQVKIYQNDGTTLYRTENLTANQANANAGVSGNHGFAATFTDIPAATYKVKLYAIDYNGDGDTQIGATQTVTVTGSQPSGRIDACAGGEGQITISGWAYDPDATTESIGVQVKVYQSNGTTLYKQESLNADRPRDDVNNTYHITGQHGYSATIDIAAAGTYKVKVYAIDYNGDGNPQIGSTQTVTVTPKPITVTIGDEAFTSYRFPFVMNENYSITEQIYTAEEIGMAGTITSIAFQYASSGAFSMSGVQVYLKHTDKNNFDDYSMVSLSEDDKVFEGTFSATGTGWATITLDTPFEYDGNSNLLIACEDPTEGRFGTDYGFFVHNTRNTMSIDIYGFLNEIWGKVKWDFRNTLRLTITPSAFLNPENLAVSSCTEQTATLTWTRPVTANNVTGYAYQYKRAGDVSWSAEMTTTATSVTLSGLTVGTNYDFRMRTLYGSNKSSYQILHFATVTPLPYECGFENGLECWSMVDVYNYTGIDANAKHDGEYGFKFNDFTDNLKPQYLISPRFASDNAVVLSFYYRNYAWQQQETFQVGYSTTSNDISAFTWGEEITATGENWAKYEKNFPVGARFFAIKYISNNFFLFLDDFSIEENSTYAKPTSVAVSNLTDTSATLTWTAPDGSPTGYAYQYRRQGDASWSAETNVSGTSVTLSNLPANTSYDFRVKARYSGGNTSNYVTVRFMTEAAMVSLPFTEGFENGMGGWRIVDGLTQTGISANNVRNGSNSFMFIYDAAEKPQYLMSPWLNGSADMNVSFWYANGTVDNTSYRASFQVGYSTTSRDPSAFTWSEQIKSSNVWRQYSASFPAGTRFVAVKWTGGYWLYLDDFGFNGPPTTLSSADDWNLLAHCVEGGWTAEGVTIKMTDDFTATKMIGNAEHPFRGTFDGQGHTLTLDISSSGRVAPFLEINGATIKNLKVTGRMIAGGVAYSGGLVGWVAGGANLIQNCVVDTLIGMSHTDGGGIVGYDNSAAITIEGCVFTGNLYSNSSSMGGAMYATSLLGGTVGNTSTVILKNCLDASNMTGPLVRGLADAINCYYTRYDKSSQGISGGWISPARYAYSFATPPINIGEASTDYGFVQAYTNGLKYDGKYYMSPDDINLADASDNTTALSNKDGYFATVVLLGRILYKDGDWNTIVLPFDLALSGSPLDGDGVDVRTLDNSDFDSTNGTLTLNFTAKGAVTEIEAGKPYIIRWNKADGYDEAPDYTRDIVRPVFKGVTVSTATANVETASADFIGNFSPVALAAGDKTALYLGGTNTFSQPGAATTVNSCRAYFRLKGGLRAGREVKRCVLNLGGETITGEFPSPYELWSAASGLGAWNATDASGIHNVFRYAFGKPTGAFTDPPLISISFENGQVVITTPPLVNTEGFTFSILATDTPDGTDASATYSLNASGKTVIDETGKTKRFFRLKAKEK